MALGPKQQPLYRARFWRIGLCDDLADDRGTVEDLLGRTIEVVAALPISPIKEIRLQRLE